MNFMRDLSSYAKWQSVAIVVTFVGFLLPQSVLSANPREKTDNSWISVSGTVVAATPDYFWLDFGEGKIRVEMDDWDWYKEGAAILADDKVTVFGLIDNDLYESKTIEASSVYVENLNTYFYASAADEEDYSPEHRLSLFSDADHVRFVGKITSVNDREFTLDTGARKIKVDTKGLFYNPMDDYGFQRLNVGDWVRVAGEMSFDLFEKKEVMAESVVTLINDQGKSEDS